MYSNSGSNFPLIGSWDPNSSSLLSTVGDLDHSWWRAGHHWGCKKDRMLIWMFSKNRGTRKPQNGWWIIYNGRPYEQMDDLGVPLFLETPIWTDTVDGRSPANQLIWKLSNSFRRFSTSQLVQDFFDQNSTCVFSNVDNCTLATHVENEKVLKSNKMRAKATVNRCCQVAQPFLQSSATLIFWYFWIELRPRFCVFFPVLQV